MPSVRYFLSALWEFLEYELSKTVIFGIFVLQCLDSSGYLKGQENKNGKPQRAQRTQRKNKKRGDGILQNVDINVITEKIIGAAIEVHRFTGPGLFESVYEKCLCYELELQKVDFERQKVIPITYKEKTFDYGFRADLVVEERILVELKAVSSILPIHEAQLINYLNLSKVTLGLIINFNVLRLKDGIKRIVCGSL